MPSFTIPKQCKHRGENLYAPDYIFEAAGFESTVWGPPPLEVLNQYPDPLIAACRQPTASEQGTLNQVLAHLFQAGRPHLWKVPYRTLVKPGCWLVREGAAPGKYGFALGNYGVLSAHTLGSKYLAAVVAHILGWFNPLLSYIQPAEYMAGARYYASHSGNYVWSPDPVDVGVGGMLEHNSEVIDKVFRNPQFVSEKYQWAEFFKLAQEHADGFAAFIFGQGRPLAKLLASCEQYDVPPGGAPLLFYNSISERIWWLEATRGRINDFFRF